MDTPIIHVDMDAFFAAVEMRDNPELRGKPVIIGGDPRRDVRSVVSTASYEARKYGIHSAMPLIQAWRLCPQGVFMRGNMQKYAAVSQQIMQVFQRYTPLVEPISIDEAFLDVRGCERLFGPPQEIARAIRQAVAEETGLTCSVGVAANKFLAKLASDLDKPDGLTVIPSNQVEEILHPLPVGKLWGVGERTGDKLREMGIDTIGQLALLDKSLLTAAFGKLGEHLWHLARGLDERRVVTSHGVKSVSRETTFAQDVRDEDEIRATLLDLSEDVARRLRKKGLTAGTVTVKLRFGNFKTITRQGSLSAPAALTKPIYTRAVELWEKAATGGRGLRLLGVGASNLNRHGGSQQLTLFAEPDDGREQIIAETMDQLSARYGKDVVRRAAVLKTKQDDDSR
ncbi:MAG: DNA polymerase IV [Firmicutes bacterium]|nr:DNA polymerase IV [Bacillota bacterium]